MNEKTPSNPKNAHSGQSAAVSNSQKNTGNDAHIHKAESGSGQRSGGMKSEGEPNTLNTGIPKNDFA